MDEKFVELVHVLQNELAKTVVYTVANAEQLLIKGGILDLIILNSNSGSNTLELLKDGVVKKQIPLAGQAMILVNDTDTDSIKATVAPLTIGFIVKKVPGGEPNRVTYVPLQLGTQAVVTVHTTNAFIAVTSGSCSFLVLGTGVVATLTDGVLTGNLNDGSLIGTGNWFGFSNPIVAGRTYTITGATFSVAIEGI